MNERPVSSDIYTEDYYLEVASGFERYDADGNFEVHPILRQLLDRSDLREGQTAVDVGCGKGDITLTIAERGPRVIGIDYAAAALSIARDLTRKRPHVAGKATFVRCDAKTLPVPDASVDRAFMLDVVEHLHPWELTQVFAEIRRSLRPDGRLIIHTMPNLNFYRFAYPVLRTVARVAQGQRPPRDPRCQYEYDMHVNEQSPRSLRETLEATGFDVDIWFSNFVRSPLKPGQLDRVVKALGRRGPFRRYATFNIFASARPR